MSLNILVLEPYYGGSHRSFLSGLQRLPFRFELMTLPARKWKWRMRLSAPYFADKLRERDYKFDLIICSSYIDVATFRGLAPRWVRKTPLLTYFHENQFAYPVKNEDERDFHFALTNVTTALASDRLGFNSLFNLNSLLKEAEKLFQRSYDMKLNGALNLIHERSRVLPPGIDYSLIDEAKVRTQNHFPVILWNHRWEHDKNPEQFFEILFEMDRDNIDFKLVVLGESFKSYPPIFDEARERLSHRIIYSGYAQSRQEYAELLKSCDIVVSTATHEFFGMAILEAVRAGCYPLLPKRLSYPELFPEEFLYADNDLFNRLRELLLKKERLSSEQAKTLTERFSWDTLSSSYESWIINGF